MVEFHFAPQQLDSNGIGRLTTIQDITPSTDPARAIHRVSQLHAALSRINQAAVRVTTRDELFARICEALVESGKLKLAWIGWNDSVDSSVKVLGQFGDTDGCLARISVRSDDSPEGRGPVGVAIREGRPCVVTDFQQSASTRPWHAAAARYGFNASGAFPIRRGNQVCGALAVYAAEEDFFGPQETGLLLDTAADISYALDFLEGEERRRQAERMLRESEARLRTIIATEPECVKLLAADGSLLDMNPAGLRLIEADSLAQVQNCCIYPVVAEEHRAAFRDLTERVMLGESGTLEFQIIGLKGTQRWMETHASPLRDNSGQVTSVLGITRDISDRKLAEQTQAALHQISEAAQSTATLQELFSRIHEIVGELLPARNFFVTLYDDNKGELTFPYFVDEFDPPPGPHKLDDRTISSEVIRTGRSLLLTPDVQLEQREMWKRAAGSESVDWLGVPLKSRSRTIGALVVQSYSGDVRYTDKDKDLLEFVSGQVASAIERKQAHAALRESESRLEEAQRLGHLGSWSWDLATGVLHWSDELCRIYGLEPGSHVPSFEDFLARVHPDDRAAVEALVTQTLNDQTPMSYELRVVRPNGEVRAIFDQGEVLIDEQGRSTGMVGACLDITARKQEELLERDRRQILEQVTQNQPLPEILANIVRMLEAQIPATRGSILYLRDGRLWLGAAPHLPDAYTQALEGLAIGPTAGTCGTACYRGETVITEDIATDPHWDGYRELALPHGLRACWSMPIPASKGGVMGSFAVYPDQPGGPSPHDLEFMRTATRLAALAIEHRLLTDELSHQAHHDALTGLPNRLLFQDRLGQALAQAERKKHQVAVFYMDLDRFKSINDMLGHSSGDSLLQQVASRLQACLRKTDTLARLGGDEFTVVVNELSDPQHAMRVATKLIEAMRAPFHVDGHELFVTLSLGISIYPDDGADNATLMANADAAMYRAKETGRDNFQWFAAEMNTVAKERMRMDGQLRHALRLGQLSLHYQPQCGVDGEIQGFEALMRWQHPTLGMVSPARFIPLAEASGQIVQLGEWALRTACAQMVAWRQAGHQNLRIAVNVSAVQFKRADWVDTVRRALHDTQLAPEALELEITESLLLHNLSETSTNLFELRNLGVGIAIDDFGTGYSCLSYLHKLPITTLKIDQAFVREIGLESLPGQEEAPIIRTIIALARNLGMSVVAEGVETNTQRNLLLSLGCEGLQGFLLHRPMPVDQVDLLLNPALNPAGKKQLASAREPVVDRLAPHPGGNAAQSATLATVGGIKTDQA